MSNITKYEFLKHRHLSLLLALDSHGVSVKFDDATDAWMVNDKNDVLIRNHATLLEERNAARFNVVIKDETGEHSLEEWRKRNAPVCALFARCPASCYCPRVPCQGGLG